MKTWQICMVTVVLCGCAPSEGPPPANPDAETIRARMPLLRNDMLRSQAEKVLGLKHSHTNNGVVWKYSLPTNNAVFLWFDPNRDTNASSSTNQITRLTSATLDFQTVTSKVATLWSGMTIDEVEKELGLRRAPGASGTSSGFSITYEFDDPEYPQTDYPAHEVTVRLSTPIWTSLDIEDILEWVRAKGRLVWLWIDHVAVYPPKKRTE